MKLKYANIGIFSFILFLAPILFLIHAEAATLVVSGQSFYSSNGLPVSSGTISGTILESGETNTTSIMSNGTWEFILVSSLTFNETRKNLGMFISNSDMSGFHSIEVGIGQMAEGTRSCQANRRNLSGIAMDTSSREKVSGNVRVEVEGIGFVNSTSFSNGIWSISAEPCLVPGKTYEFQIFLSDESGNTGTIFLRHVGRS